LALTRRIEIDWRILPSDARKGGKVVVPYLSVQMEGVTGLHEAVLAPSARRTVLPTVLAVELGANLSGLPESPDPLFPGLELRYGPTCELRVFGKPLGDYLLVKVPVAYESAGKLEPVVLGEGFFQLVRLHFTPDEEHGSWIEHFRALY
jgi:hypothetical protein